MLTQLNNFGIKLKLKYVLYTELGKIVEIMHLTIIRQKIQEIIYLKLDIDQGKK